MTRFIILVAIAIVILCPARLFAGSEFPLIQQVDHSTISPGNSLTITSTNVDTVSVAAVYLTDGSDDCKPEINSQTKTAITVMIPADAGTGRFALMFLTRGETPRLIEQPVKVTVQ